MICKSLETVAMVCLLAAFVSISAGTASEDGAADPSALSGADEVTTMDELEEMNNGSSSNSANQSSNESSLKNVTVIDLSTLDDGSEADESPNATVISYTTPSSSDDDGSEVASEVTDVKVLSDSLEASVVENALNLSTLENGSAEAGGPDTTVISYTIPSSSGSAGEEPTDVRVLGDVLEPSPSSNVTNLSTLDGEAVTEESVTEDADNETERGYESLSSATTDESEVTDVKALSEILGY